MATKPGERKKKILETLAAMLENPRGEKITTAALAARLGWMPSSNNTRHAPSALRCQTEWKPPIMNLGFALGRRSS